MICPVPAGEPLPTSDEDVLWDQLTEAINPKSIQHLTGSPLLLINQSLNRVLRCGASGFCSRIRYDYGLGVCAFRMNLRS